MTDSIERFLSAVERIATALELLTTPIVVQQGEVSATVSEDLTPEPDDDFDAQVAAMAAKIPPAKRKATPERSDGGAR